MIFGMSKSKNVSMPYKYRINALSEKVGNITWSQKLPS